MMKKVSTFRNVSWDKLLLLSYKSIQAEHYLRDLSLHILYTRNNSMFKTERRHYLVLMKQAFPCQYTN